MSWDRDEAASLLELMGTLTDRMRDLAEIFTPTTGKQSGEPDDPTRPRGRNGAGVDIDIDSIKLFTQAIRDATAPVITFGKSIDALGDRLTALMKEQVNIGSAGGFRPPGDADNARPASGQRQYPDTAPASYYNPEKPYTKPNLPDGMYTPIRNYKDAEKWFIESQIASGASKAQAYYDLKVNTTPDMMDYIGMAKFGHDPKMIGKIALQDAQDDFVRLVQKASAVPANIKPKRVPKVPYMTRGQRLRARVSKGIFWGGTTGGLRGAVRGGIMGAGYNLFANSTAVGTAIAFAMPKIMEMTAMSVSRQVDANRQYSAFAPETMNALVNYDLHTLMRGMEFARETSKTATNLINQQDSTLQAMQPYEIASRNVGNTLGTFGSAIAGRFFQQSGGVWNDINNFVSSDEVQAGAGKLGKELMDTGIGAASWGAAVWLLSFLIPPVGALTGAAAFVGGVAGLLGSLDNGGVAPPAAPGRHPLDDWQPVAPRPRAF